MNLFTVFRSNIGESADMHCLVDLAAFEILNNGKISYMTIKNIADIASYKTEDLDYDKYMEIEIKKQLGENIETNFREKLEKNIIVYKVFGMYKVLERSALMHTIATEIMKKRKLFGDTLDDSIEHAKHMYSYSLDFSTWEGKGTPLQMVYPHCIRIKNLGINTELSFSSNIGDDGEDGLFDKLNVANKDYKVFSTNKFESSSYFSETMDKIYKASVVLFSDDSNGRSNLSELYYSITNKLKTEAILKISAFLAKQYPENKEFLAISKYIDRPHKKRTKSYNDTINVWDGHLSYQLYSQKYNYKNLGNENIVNNILDQGIQIMNLVFDAVKTYRELDPVEFYLKVYSSIKKECGYIHLAGEWGKRYIPQTILDVLNGVVAAVDLEQTLLAEGITMASFSCAEVRQNTWKRFSNLKEFTKYFKVHEMIPSVFSVDKYKSGVGNSVDILKLTSQKSLEKSSDSILDKLFSTKIQPRSTIHVEKNRKSIYPQTQKIINLLETFMEDVKMTDIESRLSTSSMIDGLYSITLSVTNIAVIVSGEGNILNNIEKDFSNKNVNESLLIKQIDMLSKSIEHMASNENLKKRIEPWASRYLNELKDLANKNNAYSVRVICIEFMNKIHEMFLSIDSNQLCYKLMSKNIYKNILNNCTNFFVFKDLTKNNKNLQDIIKIEYDTVMKNCDDNKPNKSFLDLSVSILSEKKLEEIRVANSLESVMFKVVYNLLQHLKMDVNEHLGNFYNDDLSSWAENKVLFKRIKDILSMLEEDLKTKDVNYLSKVLDRSSLDTTFKDSLREINNIFLNEYNRGSSNINKAEIILKEKLDELNVWKLDSQSVIIGVDGMPIIRNISEQHSKSHYNDYKGVVEIYSVLGIKVTYPAEPYHVELMEIEDIEYIISAIERQVSGG